MVSALKELKDCLSTEGPLRTVNIIWGRFLELAFDWRYRTDTTRRIEQVELDVTSANKQEATRYQPSGLRTLRSLFRHMKFPHDAVFVDFGCGKGRVLLLAAAYGFKRVVGIEFSPELCAIARENVISFGKRRKISEVEIVQGDVCDYKMKGDETIFYYFHPFSADILNRTLDKIVESLTIYPRRAWIFYYLPRHGKVFDDRPQFRQVSKRVFGEYEAIVYEYKPK
jgi:SAM-dependent methyltransferase